MAADFVASHGRSPSRVETTRARHHPTRATRPPKVVRPLRDLLAEWVNRARTLTGVEPHDLATRALAGTNARGLRAHDVGTEVRPAVVAAVLDDATTRRSVWTTWNLGTAAVRATLPLRTASPAERLRLLNEVTTKAAARCVHLDDTRDPEQVRVGEVLYTSTELLAAEKSLIDASEAPGAATIDPQLVDNPRYRVHHQLYEAIGDGALARGRAHAAVEATLVTTGTDWRRNGHAVVLRREADRWSLAPSHLVIVDEASLADTRSLAAVVDQAEAAGAKVLLVGDHPQSAPLHHERVLDGPERQFPS